MLINQNSKQNTKLDIVNLFDHVLVTLTYLFYNKMCLVNSISAIYSNKNIAHNMIIIYNYNIYIQLHFQKNVHYVYNVHIFFQNYNSTLFIDFTFMYQSINVGSFCNNL